MVYIVRNVQASDFVNTMRFTKMTFTAATAAGVIVGDSTANIAETSTDYDVIKTSDGTIDVG